MCVGFTKCCLIPNNSRNEWQTRDFSYIWGALGTWTRANQEWVLDFVHDAVRPPRSNTPHGLFLLILIMMLHVVTRLVAHRYSGYDCICAGAEDSLRVPNQAWNDAAGSESPLPYRSSCVGLTLKAKNSWNSVPCSTQAPAGHCWRYANPCGAGRGYPWKYLLHLF